MYREQAGFTQQRAAFQIGVSKTSIANWENGRKIPSPDHLHHIALLYGISGDDIHILDSLALMSRNELISKLCEVLDPDDFGG